MKNIAPPKTESTPSCVLYVCTSCRTKGTPREPRENRQGFVLYQELKSLMDNSVLQASVDIQPAECLSICPRPCGIALLSSNSWTYLFGDQKPKETAHEIIKCISLYLHSRQGFMQRSMRPKSLQSSILGRIPPRKGEKNALS